jgi:hypothetical protein
VQERAFWSTARLLDLEVDLSFLDTTTTYFATDEEDEADDGLRRYGRPSKDHRLDLPQVPTGLAVTRGGLLVRCWAWPRNTTDASEVNDVQRVRIPDRIRAHVLLCRLALLLVREIETETGSICRALARRSGAGRPGRSSRERRGRPDGRGTRRRTAQSLENTGHSDTAEDPKDISADRSGVDTMPVTTIAGRRGYDWLPGGLFVHGCRTPQDRWRRNRTDN